jgi:Domain of unknown function (DUF1917)
MKSQRKKTDEVPATIDPKPSVVTDVYWLHAKRKCGTYPADTKNSGKWLVFVPLSQIDEVWAQIKLATEEGRLGSAAKVATAMPNANATNPDKRVICVYTYDWKDEEDVRRVRQELRALGISSKIPYKSDEDSRAGRYKNRGHKHISKYYE